MIDPLDYVTTSTDPDAEARPREPIMLADLLGLSDLSNWKMSFYRPGRHGWGERDAIRAFRANRDSLLVDHHLWHWPNKGRDYSVGTKLICLTQLEPGGSRYLLTDVVTITATDVVADRDENHCYDHARMKTMERFEGRIVVNSHYREQNGRPWASTALATCQVHELLAPEWEFDDEFPGYHLVNVSWSELKAIIDGRVASWRTALKNQKGIYLITDDSNGKHYVGAAYGQDELWGRWSQYAATGHGGNVGLKKVAEQYGPDHIRRHFCFSLLETTGPLTPDAEVIAREAYWKATLMTRIHGYNEN